MGNCLGRCFGISDKRRKFLRTKYSVERDVSIEFENLMDDDNNDNEMTRLVTEREKQFLMSKNYTDIVNQQKLLDAEIDTKLGQEEEEIRAEEEKFYEAKREAARVAKLQRAKEANAKNKSTKHGKSWLGDDENEWDVAGGEDDFDMFLESVKARSLKKTYLNHGSTDGQSSTSSLSGTQTKDKSSSIDLEWEHEEGVVPQKRTRSSTEENIYASLGSKVKESPVHSVELEWDNDFVSADTEELISKTTRNDS